MTSDAPLALEPRDYENWSRMIRVTGVPTATPQSDEEALALVRWAAQEGYRVRPMGAFHTWSPLAFEEASRVIAVDQSRMTGLIDFAYDPVPAATFRAGTTLAEAVRALEAIDNRGASEAPGWAWPDYPGVPDVTIGGMLAIGAHGAGIRQREDQPDLFGTVSNLVIGFRAIVSDGDDYVIREFRRDEPEAAALLVHLGAAYLLSVTMRVVPNSYLGRRVDYPDWEVAYAPTPAAGSMQALVEEHGRVQALWFPFTQTPLVQHFTEEGYVEGPRVTEPLTVRLSPDLPTAFTTAFTQTLAHLPWHTPLVERATLREMRHLSPPDHEWHGTSGNMLLYVQHDTLRVVSLAYAVHVRAGAVQAAIHDIAHHFDQMLHDYAHAGHDPINSCLEMRVTDVDRADAVGVPGAVPALLSPGLPLGDSERVIWIDLVTTPGMPLAWQFYAEYEAWLWERFPGSLRPEWSKAWAVSAEGPWTDPTVLAWVREAIRPAVATWDALDARGVFGSPLLDRLRA
jgi:FAD/FMN-containing dehydrogenase